MMKPDDSTITITIRILRKDSFLPEKMSAGAAGYDLRYSGESTIKLEPSAYKLIPCGFAIEIPVGFEAQIRPRSGLAVEHGITVLNSPGTIDSDYRGEVKVCLINHGRQDFKIDPGDRIAQIVFAKLPKIVLSVSDKLSDTQRGQTGFGSTGK